MKHAKKQRIGNKVIGELKQRRRRRHKNGKEQQLCAYNHVIKFEAARTHFLTDAFVAVAVVFT